MFENEWLKGLIKRAPGIRNFVKRKELLEKELDESRISLVEISQRAIDYRLELKKIRNEKVNVVFVCHRPAVWESLHSVYDAIKKDDLFNVYIVAIPNKKELPKLNLSHEIYESEGAEDFWKDYGCINGYDYKTKKWFDLRKLNPDYVFFQQPYNVQRCEEYKSWNVAKYAKICYISYFSAFSFGKIYDECTPLDFVRCVSFYFSQNTKDQRYLKKRCAMGGNNTKCVMTGSPRYDNLEKIKKYSGIWKDTTHKRYRIIWTPRWTTNEGNCHFFEYKDKLIDFCTKNEVELVFRPHPQAFLEWTATGEFGEKEQIKLRKIFGSNKYLHLDESANYLDLFYSSDCLVTDPSSVVFDYFLTGKPIILSDIKGSGNFEMIQEGLYKENDWEKVEKRLIRLIKGNDRLKEKRRDIIKEAYFFNENGAGEMIKNVLKQDANK